MSLPDFPQVDTDAISTLANNLSNISNAAADTGLGTKNLRDAVVQHEHWQGNASQMWHAAVTERIGDAGLTNDVFGTASSKLAQLATDLADERSGFNRLKQQIESQQIARTPGYSRGAPIPPDVADPDGCRALRQCVARAEALLDRTAKDLLELAILAGDIRAKPAKNRTPGVPDGTDRKLASLHLLAVIFGSVRSSKKTGDKFEDEVLKELGIPKNNDIWRPNPAFEGKLTAKGQAVGTIPDGKGTNFLFEAKGGKTDLNHRFQLRLQEHYAEASGRPLWIMADDAKSVDDSVIEGAEETGGGVIFRKGSGDYVDDRGNKVDVSYDDSNKTLHVGGYHGSTGGGTDPGGATLPDPDEPAAPVNPDPPGGGVEPDPIDPVDPIAPVDPVDPVDPVE